MVASNKANDDLAISTDILSIVYPFLASANTLFFQIGQTTFRRFFESKQDEKKRTSCEAAKHSQRRLRIEDLCGGVKKYYFPERICSRAFMAIVVRDDSIGLSKMSYVQDFLQGRL
ncbi:hypothetical protein F0562_028821 [Nyssa sinensis]|uniref:Uncharacterized protein n=1 Tax=Nyssa sinensis TaxID=561372 RepID=A0A5J5AZ79_9ASTE|nr:hypothetical protein F0562_028821 [Nyssa sinensis]